MRDSSCHHLIEVILQFDLLVLEQLSKILEYNHNWVFVLEMQGTRLNRDYIFAILLVYSLIYFRFWITIPFLLNTPFLKDLGLYCLRSNQKTLSLLVVI